MTACLGSHYAKCYWDQWCKCPFHFNTKGNAAWHDTLDAADRRTGETYFKCLKDNSFLCSFDRGVCKKYPWREKGLHPVVRDMETKPLQLYSQFSEWVGSNSYQAEGNWEPGLLDSILSHVTDPPHFLPLSPMWEAALKSRFAPLGKPVVLKICSTPPRLALATSLAAPTSFVNSREAKIICGFLINLHLTGQKQSVPLSMTAQRKEQKPALYLYLLENRGFFSFPFPTFMSFTAFLVLFNSFASFIQQLGERWFDETHLLMGPCWPGSFTLLFFSPTSCSNKSSTALKAIDSEMAWGNYQPGRLRGLPVK